MCIHCSFLTCNNHAVCWHQAVVTLCDVELLEDLHGSQIPIQSTSRHVMIPMKYMHQAVDVLTLKTLLMPGSGGTMKSSF